MKSLKTSEGTRPGQTGLEVVVVCCLYKKLYEFKNVIAESLESEKNHAESNMLPS